MTFTLYRAGRAIGNMTFTLYYTGQVGLGNRPFLGKDDISKSSLGFKKLYLKMQCS